MTERGGVDWTELHARIAHASAASARLLRPNEDEARRILDERARTLARPLAVIVDEEHVDLACFAVGGEYFAIETRFVMQIVAGPEPERLPWVPPIFRGVVNHRGEALPVVDLPALLTGTAAPEALRLMIVLGTEHPELGIAIEAAEEILQVPLAEIRTEGLPDALRAAGFVRGVHRAARTVLDGAQLLSEPRLFLLSEEP